MSDRRYPCLCRVDASMRLADPLLGLDTRGTSLSVALGEDEEQIRIVLSSSGRHGLVPAGSVSYTLREDLVLAVMDRLEEAIEDAQDAASPVPAEIRAREETLALFDRCLDDLLSAAAAAENGPDRA